MATLVDRRTPETRAVVAVPASQPYGGGVVVMAALKGLNDERRAAFRLAMSGSSPKAPARQSAVQSGPAWRVALMKFSGMLSRRPVLVVSEGLGPLSVLAGLYGLASRRATVLVFLPEPPTRLRLLDRLVLRLADGVLVDGDAAARAASHPRFPARSVHRIAPRYALDPFLRIPPERTAAEDRRIVVVGDITPNSGAADLLVAVMSWAEAHPDQTVELHWVGEGDLTGVLAAQPLPPNVSQAFPGPLDPAEWAGVFAQCGLLVVPSIVEDDRAPLAEGLAAGLPVVGSRRSRAVRHFVTDDVNGWLFDPLAPGEMLGALTRAFAATGDRLAGMRARAQASVRITPSGDVLARERRPDLRADVPASFAPRATAPRAS